MKELIKPPLMAESLPTEDLHGVWKTVAGLATHPAELGEESAGALGTRMDRSLAAMIESLTAWQPSPGAEERIQKELFVMDLLDALEAVARETTHLSLAGIVERRDRPITNVLFEFQESLIDTALEDPDYDVENCVGLAERGLELLGQIRQRACVP